MAGAETAPLYAPFTAPPTLEQTQQTNPLLRQGRKSIHFHWEDMDFHLDGSGRIHRTIGAEAHVTWCLKTLLTERFYHLVYTHAYGVEFDEAMTGGRARAVTEAMARHSIVEALSRHPDTRSVGGIAFRWNGDELFMEVTINSFTTEEPIVLQLSAGGHH